MKCYYHPDIEAIATCTNCGRAICQTDVVDVAGRIVCKECLATGKVSSSSSVVQAAPTNSLAMVSLALGILGLVGCCCSPLLAIAFGVPGSIIGYIARKQIMISQGRQQGLQLATIGMAIGMGEVALALLWLLVFVGIYGAGTLAEFLQQFLQQR